MAGRTGIIAGAGMAAGLAAASIPLLWRHGCRTWGATPGEITARLPGDELLPEADIIMTRAVTIGAPPDCVWPWLVQIGSGRAGAYTYDWAQNFLGMDMHSADVILPQFQDIRLGNELRLSPGGGALRVEVIEPERAYACRYTGGGWVWIIALLPRDGATRLVCRNRLRATSATARIAYSVVMEPSSLVMERKMLLGIKERAERLAFEREQSAELLAFEREQSADTRPDRALVS
jgi:hypothetical protein